VPVGTEGERMSIAALDRGDTRTIIAEVLNRCSTAGLGWV
jgi:hypothetical protein